MPPRLSFGRFAAVSFLLWLVMIVVLVVVPDWLERWLPIEIARALGWAVAGGLWMVSIEHHWKARYGPFVRFIVQLCLWVSAAIIATWISEQARVRI